MISVLTALALVGAASGPEVSSNTPPTVQTDAASSELVEKAILASPALSAQLEKLKQGGQFKGFSVITETGGQPEGRTALRAWRKSGVIILRADLVEDLRTSDRRFRTFDYTKNNPNDLVFVVAFLATKIETEADLMRLEQESMIKFRESVKSAPPGSPIDVTALLKEGIDRNIKNDARAYIVGWNAICDAATKAKGMPLTPKEWAELFMKSRYCAALFKSMRNPANRIVIPASMTMALDEHNIAAVATALTTMPMPDFR